MEISCFFNNIIVKCYCKLKEMIRKCPVVAVIDNIYVKNKIEKT